MKRNPNSSITILNAAALDAQQLPELSRRSILQGGAGLTLAIMAGPLLTACAPKSGAVATGPLAPGQFLRVGTDSTVTVISANTEVGQGG